MQWFLRGQSTPSIPVYHVEASTAPHKSNSMKHSVLIEFTEHPPIISLFNFCPESKKSSNKFTCTCRTVGTSGSTLFCASRFTSTVFIFSMIFFLLYLYYLICWYIHSMRTMGYHHSLMLRVTWKQLCVKSFYSMSKQLNWIELLRLWISHITAPHRLLTIVGRFLCLQQTLYKWTLHAKYSHLFHSSFRMYLHSERTQTKFAIQCELSGELWWYWSWISPASYQSLF